MFSSKRDSQREEKGEEFPQKVHEKEEERFKRNRDRSWESGQSSPCHGSSIQSAASHLQKLQRRNWRKKSGSAPS